LINSGDLLMTKSKCVFFFLETKNSFLRSPPVILHNHTIALLILEENSNGRGILNSKQDNELGAQLRKRQLGNPPISAFSFVMNFHWGLCVEIFFERQKTMNPNIKKVDENIK
jgi:hypothetical protein